MGGARLSAPEPARRSEIAAVLRDMWADTAMRQNCIAATLTSAVGHGALAWLPSFLLRTHGLDLAGAGLYLALVAGIGGPGAWLGGVMTDRLGARDPRWALRFLALVSVATKPLSIAFYLVGSTALALALFELPGMAGAIFAGPSVAVLHGRVRPAQRPLASAVFLFLINLINLIGLGIGPLAGGRRTGRGALFLRRAHAPQRAGGMISGAPALRSPMAAIAPSRRQR